MASKNCGLGIADSELNFFTHGARFGVPRLDAAFETAVAQLPFGSKIGIVIYELKRE
jgi:hypothetical protein